MKFLANENIPYPSIKLLRLAGHSVLSVSELSRGISDIEVIQLAIKEDAIILTFDKDYGEILFRHNKSGPVPAVVFFRFKGNDPETAGKSLLKLLSETKIVLQHKFTVIDREGIRQRGY